MCAGAYELELVDGVALADGVGLELLELENKERKCRAAGDSLVVVAIGRGSRGLGWPNRML